MKKAHPTRITADLGNPLLIQMIKLEAQQKNLTLREVLVAALEAYFGHRLEQQLMYKAAQETMQEWQDPKEDAYDKL